MWSKKTFLRVRVRFVECKDTLMQILASLDRDKNRSVSIALFLMLQWEESENWLTVGLCFVTTITNQACEWEETCFIFFYFWWPIGLASERQTLLVCPRFPLVTRRKRALKKIFFASYFIKKRWFKIFQIVKYFKIFFPKFIITRYTLVTKYFHPKIL